MNKNKGQKAVTKGERRHKRCPVCVIIEMIKALETFEHKKALQKQLNNSLEKAKIRIIETRRIDHINWCNKEHRILGKYLRKLNPQFKVLPFWKVKQQYKRELQRLMLEFISTHELYFETWETYKAYKLAGGEDHPETKFFLSEVKRLRHKRAQSARRLEEFRHRVNFIES